MDIMNISSINISKAIATDDLFSALNVTCDIHTADTDLIPSIMNLTNGSSPFMVLNKLGNAGAEKSCLWLQDEAESDGRVNAKVDCSELSEICKRWSSIKEYNEAKSNIFNYNSSMTISHNITDTYVMSKFFSSEVAIMEILKLYR